MIIKHAKSGAIFMLDRVLTSGMLQCVLGSDSRYLSGEGFKLYNYKPYYCQNPSEAEIKSYIELKSNSVLSLTMENEIKRLEIGGII